MQETLAFVDPLTLTLTLTLITPTLTLPLTLTLGAPKALLPFTLDELLDSRLHLHAGDTISVPP